MRKINGIVIHHIILANRNYDVFTEFGNLAKMSDGLAVTSQQFKHSSSVISTLFLALLQWEKAEKKNSIAAL